MDMNQIIGAALCEAYPNKQVRMKNPDVTVGVEVVQNASYVYARSLPGIGGLPVGSSGKVVCLLSSGIDSPVATWKLARRGAVCVWRAFLGSSADFGRKRVSCRRHRARTRTNGVHCARVHGAFRRLPARDLARGATRTARDHVPPPHVQGSGGNCAPRARWRARPPARVWGRLPRRPLIIFAATDAAVELPVFRPLIGNRQTGNHRRSRTAWLLRDIFAGCSRLLYAVHAPRTRDPCEAPRCSQSRILAALSNAGWTKSSTQPRFATTPALHTEARRGLDELLARTKVQERRFRRASDSTYRMFVWTAQRRRRRA